MKLPACLQASDPLTRLEMIAWLTNAGTRIEDSPVFKREAPRFEQGLRSLADLAQPGTGELSAGAIAASVIAVDATKRSDYFCLLAWACLVLTGQSDNALKCQFPVFLMSGDYSEAQRILALRSPTIARPALQVVDMERVARRINASDGKGLRQLVAAYFECLFSRANMPRLYSAIAAIGQLTTVAATSVLEVMALTAIRGSATASGGHLPEEQLRMQMEEWGLVRGEDFNYADVAARELALLSKKALTSEFYQKAQKSRAFDFVLPYKVPGRTPRLLVQGQFYAGDSGSVSHKNVDQTPTGRSAAQDVVSHPIFAEFLDGAGYVTALSGDAERLLTLPGTDGLVQLRTAPIRLREMLQRIDLCTPLEVAHAAWQSESVQKQGVEDLLSARYSGDEVRRVVARAESQGWVSASVNGLKVNEGKSSIALEYAILDTVAIVAASSPGGAREAGGIAVPGYGMTDWGVTVDGVRSALVEMLPGVETELSPGRFELLIESLQSKTRLRSIR